MHILLLPSWYPRTSNDVGGVFFRDQALALHNHGHKVGVIAPLMCSLRKLGKGGCTPKPLAFVNDNGVLTYRKELLAAFPRLPYGNYWLFKRVAKELFKRYIIENGKPDILHAHALVYGGAVGAELASEFNIPLVLTEHSSGFARKAYTKWQLKLARQGIEAAHSCISVSPSLAKMLSEQFPECNADWKWIPNVVASRFKQPREAKKGNRAVRFLSLALMTKNKGQLDLLKAFAGLTLEGMNAELWLAGDGVIRNELKRMVETAGLTGKVRFLGLVEPGKVPELLAQVDVVVVSSHYETFGVVAAEALMAGVPVVATRCGGPECIVEEGDGLLASPQDAKELQKAMANVGGNLTNYNSQDIAERAEARFSDHAIGRLLTEEYERLIV